MSGRLLRVAVVGHTNTGKTSLMRTLMRDVGFGEVSDRPAVTRRVEAAVLTANGRPVVELHDTPGLEDSIGLLEYLESKGASVRGGGVEAIDAFLGGDPVAQGRFTQEAKALRQVRETDVSLYVIDVRDRVLGKHRDELTILGMCARPIVPVLNFTASPDARTESWREHLARVNMHAVAEFDTVVFNAVDERRLFEKMRTLLDGYAVTLDALIVDRQSTRQLLLRSSAVLVAELLVDVAAFRLLAPAGKRADVRAVIEELKGAVRDREQKCVEALLDLHQFRSEDVGASDLPLEGGAWGMDLFSRAAMKQFGVSAGGGAAAGAMVGLAVDAMVGGVSLGAGAATGAAIGGLIGAARTHGRKMMERMRGLTEVRVEPRTLQLLAVRQIALVRALLGRGHATMGVIEAPSAKTLRDVALPDALMERLEEARLYPEWSLLDAASPDLPPIGAGRAEELQAVALLVEPLLGGGVRGGRGGGGARGGDG